MQMRRLYSLLLLSLFLIHSPDGLCQESEFRWERTDRTTDGWMGGIDSDADMAITPGGVTLIAASEGIFRIVERTEQGITGHYAELINREINGPISFLGTIDERIYLLRTDGQSARTSTDGGATWRPGSEVWASSNDGVTWELIIAEVDISHVTLVDDGSTAGSGITAYDAESDSLLVFDPTGRQIATRRLPFEQGEDFPSPQGMLASPSGLLYFWDEYDATTPIFRSSDLGATWERTEQRGLEEDRLHYLLHAGDSLIIGATAKGLVASHDLGESWTLWEWTIQDSSEDYRNWRYYTLSVGEDHIIATWFSAVTRHNETHPLMQSVDGGRNWIECGETPTTTFTMMEEESLYGFTGGVLLRSDGCGSPWKRVHGDFRSVYTGSVISIGNDFFAEVSAVLPGKDEARGQNYLMRSRDDGATWEPIMDSLSSILKVSEGGTLYVLVTRPAATSDTGDVTVERRRDILQSTDGGETWHSLSDAGAPPPAQWPYSGSGWEALQLQGEEYVMVYRKEGEENGESRTNALLSYSSDGGATFEAIDSATLRGDTEVDYAQVLLLPDGRIYGGPVGYRNESTVLGRFDPRTGLHEQLPTPVPFTDLQIAQSGRLYGWTAEWRDLVRRDSAGRLFYSDDGGETWAEVVTPEPEQVIREVSEGTDGTLHVVLGRGARNEKTHQSTDGGVTWSRTADPGRDITPDSVSGLPLYAMEIESVDTLRDLHLAKFHYLTYDTVGAGYLRRTDGAMLVYSRNAGRQSWHSAFDEGVLDQEIWSFAINDRGVVVAGTWSGGLYRTVGPSGVVEEVRGWPVRIDLR